MLSRQVDVGERGAMGGEGDVLQHGLNCRLLRHHHHVDRYVKAGFVRVG